MAHFYYSEYISHIYINVEDLRYSFCASFDMIGILSLNIHTTIKVQITVVVTMILM